MTPPLTANELPSERPVAAIASHALTILAALAAIGFPLLVLRFAPVFCDILGDHPLPLPTILVLRFQPLLLLLACAAALAAIYLAWQYRTRPMPRLFQFGLLVAIIAQTAFTAYALFLPLSGIAKSR